MIIAFFFLSEEMLSYCQMELHHLTFPQATFKGSHLSNIVADVCYFIFLLEPFLRV